MQCFIRPIPARFSFLHTAKADHRNEEMQQQETGMESNIRKQCFKTICDYLLSMETMRTMVCVCMCVQLFSVHQSLSDSPKLITFSFANAHSIWKSHAMHTKKYMVHSMLTPLFFTDPKFHSELHSELLQENHCHSSAMCSTKASVFHLLAHQFLHCGQRMNEISTSIGENRKQHNLPYDASICMNAWWYVREKRTQFIQIIHTQNPENKRADMRNLHRASYVCICIIIDGNINEKWKSIKWFRAFRK